MEEGQSAPRSRHNIRNIDTAQCRRGILIRHHSPVNPRSQTGGIYCDSRTSRSICRRRSHRRRHRQPLRSRSRERRSLVRHRGSGGGKDLYRLHRCGNPSRCYKHQARRLQVGIRSRAARCHVEHHQEVHRRVRRLPRRHSNPTVIRPRLQGRGSRRLHRIVQRSRCR